MPSVYSNCAKGLIVGTLLACALAAGAWSTASSTLAEVRRMREDWQAAQAEQADRLASSIRSLESLVQREEAQQTLLASASKQHGDVRVAIEALSAAQGRSSSSIAAKLETLASSSEATEGLAAQAAGMAAKLETLASAEATAGLATQATSIAAKLETLASSEATAGLAAQAASIAAKLETLTSSEATAGLAAQAAGIAAKLEKLSAAATVSAAPATPPAASARVASPPSAPKAQPLPPPPPAPRRPVQLVFHFDGNDLAPSAKTASVYWLSHNSSEHLYTEIPRGMQVVETTQPGECWRVRDAHSGNHLVTRYCASSDPRQDVVVKGQHDVVVEFAFPKLAATSKLTGSTIEILETPAAAASQALVPGASVGSRIGVLPRGGHLTTQSAAGTAFVAVESGTGRVLGRTMLTSEAKQYVTFGGGDAAASVEFIAPRTATTALSIYHKEVDGEEHLRASLKPGESVRVHSTVGTEWVVREKESDKPVMELTTATTAAQRVHIKPDDH